MTAETGSMVQVAKALDRLDGAVTRLQEALGRHERRLEIRQTRFDEELREMRDSHTLLEGEARAVYSRLDSAIGHLRGVMEA